MSASEVLVGLHHPWRILNDSQEFLDLFQLASTECFERPLAIVVGPETNSARVMEMLEAASCGMETTANLVLYARSGQESSFFVHAKPFGSPLNPSGCLFSIISAHAQSQAAAVAEDGRVKVVVDAASFRVSHVSAAFQDMYGLPASIVLGRTLNVIHGPGTDLSKWRSMLSQSSKGMPVKDKLVTVTRDGVQMNNLMELHPVMNQHGYVSHVLVEIAPCTPIDCNVHAHAGMQSAFAMNAIPETAQAQQPGVQFDGQRGSGWKEEQVSVSDWCKPQRGVMHQHQATEVEYPLLCACSSSAALRAAGLHTHVRTHRTSSDPAYLHTYVYLYIGKRRRR